MVGGLRKKISFALLALDATAYGAVPCTEPRVRREWRSISETERKEWIDGVKV